MNLKLEWQDNPTMNPRNTKQLSALIERRHRVDWWGRRQIITPQLVTRVFGNGRKLLQLFPMMFRPNHFVVRVDSSLDTHDMDFDLLGEIYEEIEEEFVEWPWASAYGFKWHEDEGADCDSRIKWEDGSTWNEMKWPRIKRKRKIMA